MNVKKMILWGWLGGGATPFDISKISVKYNLTDFSYLSGSGSWTDTATFRAGSNVIDVRNITPNQSGGVNTACAGTAYVYDDVDGDKIMVHEIIPSINQPNVFYDRNYVEQFRISGGGQSCHVDSLNQHIYLYLENSSGTNITVKDFSGNTIETLSGPQFSQGCIIYYDFHNQKWYMAEEVTGNTRVKILERSGSTLAVTETMWFSGADGITISELFGRLINFNGTNSTGRIREQTLDGLDGIVIYPMPLSTITTEGIFEYPDGTFGFPDPSFFHGGVDLGNRLWRTDPRALYKKYLRFPDMVRFDKFNGGTISGDFNKQILTASGWVVGPVIDFNAFTNQQNLSAWEGVGDFDIEFRGSASAPDTVETTPLDSDVEYFDANQTNDGWGATTPGAWQSTPTNNRYMQFRVKPIAATPSSDITVQDLLDSLGANLKALVLDYDSTKLYVLTDSSGPANQIELGINQKSPLNSFINNTASQRYTYNSASRQTVDQDNNAHMILQILAEISGDTQGQLTVVAKRAATTTRSILFSLANTGANTHRLVFRHNASSDTVASEICIEHWGASGAVENRVGIADTSLTYKRLDFISTGSAWKIKINGVEQILNVSVGANNGNWFGDLTTPNRASRGFVFGTGTILGQGVSRLFILTDLELTSDQSTLIDNFITQENLLA